MRHLYIFDVDGTVADCTHRRHLLDGTNAGWRAFYAACIRDTPIWPVINTMARLRLSGAEIWLFSGRSDEVREDTVAWLCRYAGCREHELETTLMMRRAGDYRPDDIVKREWVDGMLEEDRKRLVAAFDDRDRVVAMWRAAGVPCFQVAPGDF